MDYLEEVRKIVLDRLKGYPVKVYLFGSRADGTAGRTSDIDVAVDPQERLPVGVLSAIREELEESRVPYTVDLVDLSQAESSFRELVRREGRLWSA